MAIRAMPIAANAKLLQANPGHLALSFALTFFAHPGGEWLNPWALLSPTGRGYGQEVLRAADKPGWKGRIALASHWAETESESGWNVAMHRLRL